MSADLAAFCYLVAGALFILALRGLSNPETSRRGNLFGMIGMTIAIVTTLASHPPTDISAWALVVLGMALAGVCAVEEIEHKCRIGNVDPVVRVENEGRL